MINFIKYKTRKYLNYFLRFYIKNHTNRKHFFSNIKISQRCKRAQVKLKSKLTCKKNDYEFKNDLPLWPSWILCVWLPPGFSHLWTMGTSRWQRRTLLRCPSDRWLTGYHKLTYTYSFYMRECIKVFSAKDSMYYR